MKFIKITCLIAIIFRIQIDATYFLYFLTKIRMCVRSIFYYIDLANKGLVQEIVILVFHEVYIINRKLHCRLEIRHLPSCDENYFSRSLCSLVK